MTFIADQTAFVAALDHSVVQCLNIDLPDECDNPELPITVNGWTIEGKVNSDYYSWVEVFKATKGDMVVEGDANDFIKATSEEAYNLFIEEVGLSTFDTYDI